MPTRFFRLTPKSFYVNLLCRLVKDMHLWLCLVSCCLFLLLSLSLSLTCPRQTRVTLVRQMAFCLAELHLWSTKSSLQVKGITYQFNLPLSNSLPFSFLSLTRRLALSPSVITHFVFMPSLHLTCIYFNNQTSSQHQLSACFHFLFGHFKSSCNQCHRLGTRCILYFIFTALNCTLF